jgi:hypothetical protein
VKFLEHLISRNGIAADPEKIRVVAEWPRLTNLTQLRSFVGLSSYYRRFIPGFADLARPLHLLTQKGQLFVWSASQESAFLALKQRLISAPVLSSPTDDGEYVLDTDTSSTALGAVLQQRQSGQLHVIAYASRVLSRVEQTYNTTRRELLAIIFEFRQFRQFLLGRHFLLRIDHSALSYLRRTLEPMGQAVRWLDYIEEYDFTIQFRNRNGSNHGNSDALSRRPHQQESGLALTERTCLRIREQETPSWPEDEQITLAVLKEAQRNDPALRPLIDILQAGVERPVWDQIQSSSEETRILWAQFQSLLLRDEVLYRQFHRADGTVSYLQFVLQASLRSSFLRHIHDTGGNVATTHLGVKKT